jgi:hypothetical protein
MTCALPRTNELSAFRVEAGSFSVDFELAVQRHRLIDAIERFSNTGRSVQADQL